MNQAKEKINKIPHHTDSATNVLVQIWMLDINEGIEGEWRRYNYCLQGFAIYPERNGDIWETLEQDGINKSKQTPEYSEKRPETGSCFSNISQMV
jgi:hypothetical protein